MTAPAVRTVVTFRSSAFNTSEAKPYFINPCCFGDDVANWLAAGLRRDGHEAGETGQEDFGWYFNFRVGGVAHCLVTGYRPGDDSNKGEWIGWLERSRTFFRGRGITPEAAQAVHNVLAGSQQVTDIRWHLRFDFDAGNEDSAAATPLP